MTSTSKAISNDNKNDTEIPVDSLTFFSTHEGMFVEIKDKKKQICNFTAQLTNEIIEKEPFPTRVYELSCRPINGKEIKFFVSIKDFESGTWVNKNLGFGSIVQPGMKKYLSTAIQTLSLQNGFTTSTQYNHTGWVNHDGHYYFLNSFGALNYNGYDKKISVQFHNTIKNYCFKRLANSADELKQAIGSSLKILDLVSSPLNYALLSSVYLTPFGEFCSADFGMFLYGNTGCYKSSIAAVLQAHDGSQFNSRNFPANWSDTENALQIKSYSTKDVLFVVDDYFPLRNKVSSELNRKADFLFRSAGNQAGKQRMTGNGKISQGYWPRGLVFATGEDIPVGDSLISRIIALEVKEEVNIEILSKLQNFAKSGILAMAKAAYIQWLSQDIGMVVDCFNAKMDEISKKIILPDLHSRTPLNIGKLMAAFHVFMVFLNSKNLINKENQKYYEEKAIKAFLDIARMQVECQADPLITGFIRNLRDILSNQTASLLPINGFLPECPSDLGIANRSGKIKPQGTIIGLVNQENIYLFPDKTYYVLKNSVEKRGEQFKITTRNFWKNLYTRGILASKDDVRETYTIRKSINGKQIPVIHLKNDIFPNIIETI